MGTNIGNVIRILLVEDNEIIREIINDMVGMQDDFEVVGSAGDGLAAMELLKSGLRPDIVLADLNMSGLNGIELTENITAQYTDLKVIILTMHSKSAFLKRALDAGARGYLLKDGDMDEIYASIRKVNAGQICISDDLKDQAEI